MLLIENGRGDGRTARALLARRSDARFSVDWRAHWAEGVAAMGERRHDVYLVGRRIGGRGALELVREAFEGPAPAPVIVLGGEDCDLGPDAHALGVADHLPSCELSLPTLERAIRWALRHHRALEGLRESQERYLLAQARLAHDALHDALTGLPNRALFLDRVGQSLARARRDPRASCAVLHLDVDRFKLVNDSLGRAVGDSLLVALSVRLAAALRPGDTVARIGGDEFAVLLQDVTDAGAASVVAGRILRAMDAPFEVGGKVLFCDACIGIALGRAGAVADELIADADIACFDAKRHGRGSTAIFHEGMRRRVIDRLARENELRQVVEGCLLGIHYQPIVNLTSGEIAGMEALARWPADWGEVAPAEFISIAEDTGIIAALGQQVLRKALATLSQWRRAGLISEGVCMSVNLSGRQLDDPSLGEQVRAAIELAQVPASALKLEITETTLACELQRAPTVFADVCSGGVGLHLDDFGTGYSSLTALHRFPVDALKIDRGFVADLGRGASDSEVIVRSTIAMAHSLGLPVIAEGIETPEQGRRLRALGCEFGQGHLFSAALGAHETTRLLAAWRPADVLELIGG
ncbi:MAG TPA: EAL domain-containing protein [Solirubrobacteraceae bacterium]|nr:EAL domain-containing protein [Solirubrobacteraceae bacterium]